MSTAAAPIEIGRVTLTVHDLPGMVAFYEQVLGLARLSSDGSAALLGAGDRVLLELRGDKAARRAGRREAGLFHTAFLMPARDDLAGWLLHVAQAQIPLQGASDHHVSEAIYLADPEGNGIEVYADRPRETWHGPDGTLIMGTETLDLNALARIARKPWTGAPTGTVVGHVHLQVGDVPRAQAFWQDTIGMGVMAQYPGAGFYGAGGYHHHIGANVWNSRGAGERSLPATGLAEVELLADADQARAIAARAGGLMLADPWATPVTIRARGV